MPIVPHDKKTEPPEDAEIWRFMKLDFFRDLMANQELYFRRTDLYKEDDPNEGLPTDAYLRRTLNLERYALEDELKLNHHQASNRLHSECYYLSCWNLCDSQNRLRMWYAYAPGGVAIRSDYRRLKGVLNGFLDEVHIGKVRYGDQEMTGYNALQILFTKGKQYEWENELRAVVCSSDPVGGQARNYRESNFPHREPQDDLHPRHAWVHSCKRRRILLGDLLTGIAVSPWASEDIIAEVHEIWAKVYGLNLPVGEDLKSPLTPSLNELKGCGFGNWAQSRWSGMTIGASFTPRPPLPPAFRVLPACVRRGCRGGRFGRGELIVRVG